MLHHLLYSQHSISIWYLRTQIYVASKKSFPILASYMTSYAHHLGASFVHIFAPNVLECRKAS